MDDKDKFDLDINDERLSEQHDAAGSQPEPEPIARACPLEVITGAHIDIEVRPFAYAFLGLGHGPKAREVRNAIWKSDAEELKAYVQSFRGITAKIVYDRSYECSECKGVYEVDPATGLTACCGLPIAEPQKEPTNAPQPR